MNIFSTVLYSLLTLVIVGYLFLKHWYSYWENRGVPHLKPKFFFGNLTGHFFLDIKNSFEKLKHHKPFFGFFTLFRPEIVVTDLDFVKTIIIKDFDSFHDRGFYHNAKDDPLSETLVNLEGEKWKHIRSKLTPTFSSGKMKFMFSTVVDLGYRLSNTVEKYIQQNPINTEVEMKDLMSRFTTDVIGTCAFGLDCNSLEDPNAEFFRIGKEVFTVKKYQGFERFIRNNFMTLARFLRLKQNYDHHIKFFTKAVNDTIEYREKNNIRRKDFMDLLIELKNSDKFSINRADILAQCFVFFAAGYETSSSLMTYTLYEMAQNLEVQEKVRKEVNRVLEKHNGELSYESLGEMTYLDQVINESLRLHTPAPVAFRVVTKNYKVPNSDLTLKKGTTVLLPYYLYHRDPEQYETPNKFNPDHFTPEAVNSRHPMAFLPFGDGPRNCIGLRFGKMESKIGLALLMKNFKFSNSPNTKIPIEVDWKSFIVFAPLQTILKVEKV